MTSANPLRNWLVREIERGGGRHDEPEIYGGEPGDLGLAGGPDSISWEINGDLASLALAGAGAILMEVVHPSVMAGVFTHSSYRTEPERRARNTLGYVLRTTFGNTAAATRVIEGVKRMHARVTGARGDGVPYRALDPELIAWVHTCIPWAVMTAFDHYARPLSDSEKSQYLREQAPIGRMGGAEWVPESLAELDDFVARMRPKLAANEQFQSFLAFGEGRSADLPVGRLERVDRWLSIRGSMALLPEWAQRLTGTRVSAGVLRGSLEPYNRLRAGLVRWAYPELPCKRLALERVRGTRREAASDSSVAAARRLASAG
jgi:uncharacterized protein (DUF2236 family)